MTISRYKLTFSVVFFVLTFNVCGVKGQIYGFDCWFENAWYKNRQANITLECTFYKPNRNCFCFRGYVTCPGRCTNYAYSPEDECRLVTEYGECCRRRECSKEIQVNNMCDKVGDVMDQNLSILPSWAFLVKSARGKRCLATLHDWKLHVLSDCDQVPLTVISPLNRLTITAVKPRDTFPFTTAIVLDRYQKIKHFRKIQEVNRPWPAYCGSASKNCALFLSSMNQSSMEIDQRVTLARKVDTGQCNLTAEEATNENYACLEILASSPSSFNPQETFRKQSPSSSTSTNSTSSSSFVPSTFSSSSSEEEKECPHFYGSAVAIKNRLSFYLIGFVVVPKQQQGQRGLGIVGDIGRQQQKCQQYFVYKDVCQQFSADPSRMDDNNFIRRKEIPNN